MLAVVCQFINKIVVKCHKDLIISISQPQYGKLSHFIQICGLLQVLLLRYKNFLSQFISLW